MKERYPDIEVGKTRSMIVRDLINRQVSDVIDSTLDRLKGLDIKSPADLGGRSEKIVDFSEKLRKGRAPYRAVLFEKLYSHYRVVRMSNKASRFLKELFNVYCDDPRQLPPGAREGIESKGKHRVICDYISGMTDRYALDQYKKFFEPYERV